VLGPLAFIIADLLIYWSGWEVVWKLGVVLIIGYAVMGGFRISKKLRPPLQMKSAIWIPVWLIGLGIISWQGQFAGGAVKPPLNTANIPFWWDIVVVAAFSLGIYYWAMFSRLPREEMLALVNEQAHEPPPPGPELAG
jgi:hypothetical protein